MSTPDYRNQRRSINGGPTGSFVNGHFIPHREVAANEDETSFPRTSQSTERSATPEWYFNPASLDQLNPAGVRAGASFPALQTSGAKISRGRDSVDEGDDKPDTPRKRRRLSPINYIKVSLRRLWPTPVNRAPLSSLPLTCGYTQSETALGQYPLEIDVDRDLPFTVFWESTGYMCMHPLQPARTVRPRTVSSPPVMAYRSSDRVRWWEPSARPVRNATPSQSDTSGPASEEGDMSTPVSPVTQVPASPRLEGESKDDDLFTQMDALEI